MSNAYVTRWNQKGATKILKKGQQRSSKYTHRKAALVFAMQLAFIGAAKANALATVTMRTHGEILQVEHICPRSSKFHTSDGDWNEFHALIESDRKEVVDSIGNLTLLRASDNSSSDAYNSSFSEKKLFASSYEQITQDVCACAKWTPKHVKDRAGRLMGKLLAALQMHESEGRCFVGRFQS